MIFYTALMFWQQDSIQISHTEELISEFLSKVKCIFVVILKIKTIVIQFTFITLAFQDRCVNSVVFPAWVRTRFKWKKNTFAFFNKCWSIGTSHYSVLYQIFISLGFSFKFIPAVRSISGTEGDLYFR